MNLSHKKNWKHGVHHHFCFYCLSTELHSLFLSLMLCLCVCVSGHLWGHQWPCGADSRPAGDRVLPETPVLLCQHHRGHQVGPDQLTVGSPVSSCLTRAGRILIAVTVTCVLFQDGAAAVAPAQSLCPGPEGTSVAGSTGLQRELHQTDRHPAGLQPGPAPGKRPELHRYYETEVTPQHNSWKIMQQKLVVS